MKPTEFNSSFWRVAVPADALRRAGYETHVINVRNWMSNTEQARSIIARSDIVHLQRVLVNDTHNLIRSWKSLGKAIVADYDDD